MTDIQTLVDRFVSDLEELVRAQALAHVSAAIAGARGAAPAAAAPQKRGPGRPPKAASAPSASTSAPARLVTKTVAKRVRRTAQDIAREADRLVVAIKAKPGSTAEQLKASTKIAAPELAIKQLLAAKRIRKTGEKRATKYFAS
jgi:hypothetical protein